MALYKASRSQVAEREERDRNRSRGTRQEEYIDEASLLVLLQPERLSILPRSTKLYQRRILRLLAEVLNTFNLCRRITVTIQPKV